MSKKEVIKRCERCGKDFLASSNYVHFCNECSMIIKKEKKERNNKSRLIAKQKKLIENGIEGIDYVIDLWNGLPTTRITGRWFKERHPNKTIKEYLNEFPNAKLVCEKTSKLISENTTKSMNRPEMKKILSERISGDKNPNARCNTTEEQRKSISPFSKSFKGYNGLSDEEKENIIKKHLQCNRDDRTTSQIKYWLNKGYSEDEAKQIISERQKTFTIEKCIKKYGEEYGLKVWKERQIKWSNKIEEQYKNGLFSKAPHSINTSTVSNAEKEFINNILVNLDKPVSKIRCYITSQLELLNNIDDICCNRRFLYDFSYKNKIIEFNGDFWHMNPNIYNEDYYNKISKTYAKNKWNIDSQKIKCAELNGYNILIIWESEYNKDKDGTIQKCIDFLTKE